MTRKSSRPYWQIVCLLTLCMAHAVASGAQDTLVLEWEKAITAFLADDDLEPSGVAVLGDRYYVVFDDRPGIGQLHQRLSDNDSIHQMIGDGGEQGFEGMTYDKTSQRFFAVIEAVPQGDSFGAVVVSFDRALNVLAEKPTTGITFERDNKGFEGVAHIRIGDELYLLLLCEGNKCKGGRKGRRRGKGRIHVFHEKDDHWAHVDKIKLPRQVKFEDYSGLDIRDGNIAVTSQQDARLWVGEWQSTGSTPADINFSIDGKGNIYRFDEDDDRYCNIEGVSFVNDNALVMVSDQKKGDDDDKCDEKDQSVHVFKVADAQP